MESLSTDLTPAEQPLRPTISLPIIFANSSLKFVAQGAEAVLYKTSYLLPSQLSALKLRPSKHYRHPILDARLTKHRILSEARVLIKCRKEGVPVPAVYALDEKGGWLMIEWIQGVVLRVMFNDWLRNQTECDMRNLHSNETLKGIMRAIGLAIGKLHSIGIVHGDLTTSNLIMKAEQLNDNLPPNELIQGEIVLIDFGLASQSSQDEDRAVDLYVLERAFGSTHPQLEVLFSEVLDAYKEGFKNTKTVLRRLEEVRMRGRKRTMLG
ncbi:EKC/KEOPS complex subunit BUD32 [Erysiphe necator]|uniref:EKC/KEOPS complex subunit BUD32 n=1 Tax=Uncinula necator TaxID=52586 RepID=A0A0B1P979_UNCNE|nr:EKC/KEOPS complex subunit BUD32 [Erysiphe necator]KHJ33895.1 putative serine threonine-protein kinase bud32 [Erysiphe necator]